MAFWKEIADTIGKKDDLLKTLTRQECEAIIDALHLLVYADGEESVLERAELEHLLHELPWTLSEGDQVELYLTKSAMCLKEANGKGDEAVREAAFGIANRLHGVKVRKRALKMAAAIAHVDWHATDHERNALRFLAEAFEIPAPFAEAMIEDIERGKNHVPSFLDEPTEPEFIPRAAEQTIRNAISASFLEGFFDDLFKEEDLRDLDDEQAMAFVDALAVALVSDGYPEEEELQEFKAQIERLPFSLKDVSRVQLRVESCLHTLRATPDHKLDTFIRAVASRIKSTPLRERALHMAIHITHADLDITSEEHSMLRRIARSFEIDDERLQALITNVRQDTEEALID